MGLPRTCSAAEFASVAVLAAGCGHSTTPGAAVSATGISMPAPTQTDVNDNGTPDSDPSDTAWPGKMQVVYEDATSPDAITGRKFMEDNNLLHQLADDINATLKLPYDVTLKASQCDVANDYWSAAENAITMCYEDATNALQVFTRLGDPDPQTSAFHTELEAFYHETGHMVISLYQLPATGREEDVADQASIYLMFRPDENGKIDPDSISAIRDTARLYEDSSAGGQVSNEALADEHSPDRARMYNFECWAYGADPKQSADLVGDDKLPEGRAERCEGEYDQLENAWGTLLKPYLRNP